MRFSNTGIMGTGVLAEVWDGEVWQERVTWECSVKGTPCQAREAYFGGIVIQPTEEWARHGRNQHPA